METTRVNFTNMVKSKTGLSDVYVEDLEIGVYNWVITFCDTNCIAKNWKNPKFLRVYVDKARSVMANVDNNSYVGNERLKARIEDGEFKPHDVPFMARDHIMPEIWRDTIDAHIRKIENAYEEKMVPMSDQFMCGRCKKREVVYFEKQTRSGDEASSLFITCVPCGNRWRIG
jgi:DNA-directed RNA polymerase subunit M/transcription elongation factor TFIIS